MLPTARKLAFSDVPVVDWPSLVGRCRRAAGACRQNRGSLRPVGFMYIKNHRIADADVAAIFRRRLPQFADRRAPRLGKIGLPPNGNAENKSLPINSVPDLIAYLKARPGAVNFGSSGRATSDLLAAAMFMLQTGTKMVDVPYAGGGQALSDMMAGSTQVMFPQLPAVLGLINSGQVRALAVTSARRLSQLPDVPTLSESGLPGFPRL